MNDHTQQHLNHRRKSKRTHIRNNPYLKKWQRTSAGCWETRRVETQSGIIDLLFSCFGQVLLSLALTLSQVCCCVCDLKHNWILLDNVFSLVLLRNLSEQYPAKIVGRSGEYVACPTYLAAQGQEHGPRTGGAVRNSNVSQKPPHLRGLVNWLAIINLSLVKYKDVNHSVILHH